ncbi:cupin-like domain-containing protein [Aurantiacibacter poecillastricola]|uniref:cupin-like domain-containing protein n=1 Tax=Aurantiacibacter poecillastricola TaxID=3064385 RepID=UPI00273F942B|nr:cupin-like domain-containing protein [Aurantiacibacter sp. 219JJ12-13]MDP5260884.1 cupin-like domain-containing protein [Aurantiacibacter sp. 219JJ12-13]
MGARPADLTSSPASVEETTGALPRGTAWQTIVEAGQPHLFRGAASDWALVGQSPAETARLLREYSSGKDVTVYRGPPEMRGRFHYNADLTGFNFTGAREPLERVLDDLLAGGDPLYVGSTDLDLYFPGFAKDNGFDLAAIHPMLAEHGGLASVWIGNETTASAHYDFSHNIAVCVAGRRRFTLFPPEQTANLYPGPLDPTPAGQVVSMVDLANPDFDRFPRFADALGAAQVAEMEPGDVLVYPAMWWHCVEALEPFNVLVNYWWNAVPGYIDSPQVTLLHGLLSLRDRPQQEREAWRGLFDYYLFGDSEIPRAHLPDHAQGPLAPIDEATARRLRAMIARKLHR